MQKPHWTKYLPNLGLFITLPFFSVKTVLLCESFNELTVEWTRIEIRVWKWDFEFRLYKRLI